MRLRKLLPLIFLFFFCSKVSAQKLAQSISYEIDCINGIHVDGDNLYAAIDDNKIQIFENEKWSKPIELLDGFVPFSGITIDTAGVIWYAGPDGLFSYDDGNITHFTTSNSALSTNRLRDVHFVGNKLWLVTSIKKLIKKEGDTFEEVTPFLNPNISLRDSETTPDGKLIVGAFGGIAVVTDTSVQEITFSGQVNNLFADHEGNIIIATSQGIKKYLYTTNEVVDMPEFDNFDGYKLAATDLNNGFYTVLENQFDLVYQDSAGNKFEFGQFDIEEPNFEEFFIFRDSLRSFGLNVNGTDSTCYVITTLDGVIFDEDDDGFFSDVDCDDTNREINPGKTEVAYNGIDDDCNAATLDDDLDEDGFNNDVDCDDTNPEINPDAMEIVNNGIDEDCDGMDLTSSTHELNNVTINIYPNPVSSVLSIETEGKLDYQVELYSIHGKLSIGNYILKLFSLNSNQAIVEKIVVTKN